MYIALQDINKKPEAFECYTARKLWDDEYTSKKMLEYHLCEDIDVSSRNYNFIKSSIEWIVYRFEIGDISSVCDFGCAVGHYTSAFARAGAVVTGLDFSKRSIEYAKKKAREESLNIDYKHMNYLDFTPEKTYDLVTMIMCDFCALSQAQRKKLLSIFYKSLKDDGHVLLDVYSFEAFEKIEEKAVYEKNQLGKFWSDSDYYAFVNTFKYNEEKVVLDKYTIVDSSETRVVYNWLQYFSIDSISDELEKNGFELVAIYGDVAGKKYCPSASEFAIVAKKI